MDWNAMISAAVVGGCITLVVKIIYDWLKGNRPVAATGITKADLEDMTKDLALVIQNQILQHDRDDQAHAVFSRLYVSKVTEQILFKKLDDFCEKVNRLTNEIAKRNGNPREVQG